MNRKTKRITPLRSEEILYRDWLITTITRSEEEYKTYRFMLQRLWNKNFYTIEDDENRCGDGLERRAWYYDNVRSPLNNPDELGPCRVLEVLIGIAKRCEFEVFSTPGNKDVKGFFWELLSNLDLTMYSISHWGTEDIIAIDSILSRWMDRAYSYDGWGGIFPLDNPKEDQRTVSIWYQMHAYLVERFFDI